MAGKIFRRPPEKSWQKLGHLDTFLLSVTTELKGMAVDVIRRPAQKSWPKSGHSDTFLLSVTANFEGDGQILPVLLE
jgi:hypothetical protein